MPSKTPNSPPDFIYCLEILYSDEAKEELIIAHLDSLGIDALEQDPLQIKVYHENKQTIEAAQEYLQTKDGLVTVSKISELENKNWNELWESGFEPIVLENCCTVRASFHPLGNTPIEIIIDPEMAFGTGHHETTYLMMLQMKDLSFRSKSVLDFGCGTGILAILAEKLGAAQIIAIDNDPIAIRCAIDCIEKNQSKHIKASTDSIAQMDKSSFDIILANINRNVLLEHSSELVSLQNSGGKLLLSGILISDIVQVKTQFEASGYHFEKEQSKGEWSSLLFTKN